MSELLRPWKRPPKSTRYVSDSMMKRARLTPFQVALIEEILLEQESKTARLDIELLYQKIRALKTPEGVEAERKNLIMVRNQATRDLALLRNEDGVKEMIAMYMHLMERYEMQNVEREKILETLRKQRKTNRELAGGKEHD